ncbi:MAG: nuclear transport factor 2 family protein [Gammaproteobacteria bacterium]|nr:nuclear transport factor 2 family protein [Gammaproteobacteria bacterium]
MVTLLTVYDTRGPGQGPCKRYTSEGAIVFATAKDAEQTFYRAFAAADFQTMKTVWADQDIACIHPGSEVLLGPQEVLDSWSRILTTQGALNLRVELLYRLTQDQQVIHVVREHFGDPIHDVTRPVVATNIYRREQDGWRMRLHHASLDAAIGATIQRVSVH